ncbi:hypothetical protein GQX74_007687 [Glossina fuscipes]|nr:hypothetical protein GQX74_007687 [Glossina fuscipes]
MVLRKHKLLPSASSSVDGVLYILIDFLFTVTFFHRSQRRGPHSLTCPFGFGFERNEIYCLIVTASVTAALLLGFGRQIENAIQILKTCGLVLDSRNVIGIVQQLSTRIPTRSIIMHASIRTLPKYTYSANKTANQNIYERKLPFNARLAANFGCPLPQAFTVHYGRVFSSTFLYIWSRGNSAIDMTSILTLKLWPYNDPKYPINTTPSLHQLERLSYLDSTIRHRDVKGVIPSDAFLHARH